MFGEIVFVRVEIFALKRRREEEKIFTFHVQNRGFFMCAFVCVVFFRFVFDAFVLPLPPPRTLAQLRVISSKPSASSPPYEKVSTLPRLLSCSSEEENGSRS